MPSGGAAVARVRRLHRNRWSPCRHHVQTRQARMSFSVRNPALRSAGRSALPKLRASPASSLALSEVRMLHPQVAVAPAAGQGGEKGRDAVLRVDAAQLGQQPQLLPGEDQLAHRGRARSSACSFFAHEHHVAIVALRAGIAGEAGQRGALGQLGGKFGFESTAAIGQRAGRR